MKEIRLADIPFPEDLTFTAHITMRDTKERRDAFKMLVRRWHPDKFSQRYGAKLCPVEKDEIIARVTELQVKIQSAFEKAEEKEERRQCHQ